MRKFFLLVAVAVAGMMQAQTVTLDPAHPTNPNALEFDANGVWTETYNEEDYFTIDYPSMSFVHGAMTDYNFWYGFTVAQCEDTTYETMADQFHCVAGGGLAGKGTPYILGYAMEGMGPTSPCEVHFDAEYLPKEVYLCTGSWAQHNVLVGGAGHTFAAGDSLVIEIQGLDYDHKVMDQKVSFFLADYRSDDPTKWTLNRDWERCDLSALGNVYGLVFTMKSSDVGTYGTNTALYFALDGLKITKDMEVATFEDVTIPAAESVLHLSQTGPIKSGSYNFYQEVADYGEWGVYYFGNLPSNKSDNSFASYLDAEKSANGGAYEGQNFNVWTMSYSGEDRITLDREHVVPGFFLNNSAYAVNSMTQGDGYAKKFTADDWFRLTVQGLLNGIPVNNQVVVDLAAEGKYINQWTWVDLSSMGLVDEIRFSLTSSDTGDSGMNTPAYFCIDNFGAEMPEGYVAPAKADFDLNEGVENTNINEQVQKMLINGQILILRGEHLYNAAGQVIK
jgi:hypothetical protein